MRGRSGAAVLALSVGSACALSCHSGSPASTDAGSGLSLSGTPGAVGASIAVVMGGSEVAVVNPDQGSVSFLDPDSLADKSDVTVGGEPHALLELPSGTLLVANYRAGEVVAIDEASHTMMKHVSVCAGPYGLALSPDSTWVAVSCEWDQTVQKLDATSLTVTPIASALHRPRALAVVGEDVFVADYIGGMVHEIAPDGRVTSVSVVPTSAPYRPALTLMTANLSSALAPAFGSLFISHALENNTGNSTLEPIASDYGTVTSTAPKINPIVTDLGNRNAPVTYAEFDGGSRVYSGPVALASFGTHYLLVAHVSTANVAVLDTTASSPDSRAVGTFTVGAGPSGIAVDAVHSRAFVDNFLDQSVSRIDLTQSLSTGAPLLTVEATLVRTLPSPYSADALAGRRLLFDATNPHVTPSGVVACASCHPGGSDDGLVWFEETPEIPLKHRRTPNLGNAKTPTSPFHWNGQFTVMSALVQNTMTNIMAGDGLLVDFDVIQPFIDEIVQAPVLPVTDASSVANGSTLFHSETVGCSGCHSGSYLTDDRLHAVLNPMSIYPGDVIPEANTPGLHGIFLAAPYFHDGRAATLEDVLTQPYAAGMGHTHGLSSSQLQDLIAYVKSL